MSFLTKLKEKTDKINTIQYLHSSYDNFIELNRDPYIGYCDTLITPDECKYLIDNSTRLSHSSVTRPTDRNKKFRTSSEYVFPDTDCQVQEIRQKICQAVKQPLDHLEKTSVIRYLPGEEFKPHRDTDFEFSTVSGGPRILTAIIYLNEVEQGGITRFPLLDIDITPKTGRVLIFHNVGLDAKQGEFKSLHQGKPVIKGEKWIASHWFTMNTVEERKRRAMHNTKAQKDLYEYKVIFQD